MTDTDFDVFAETPSAAPSTAQATPEDSTPAMTKADRQKALTEVYTEATKQLRERHLDEFNELRKALAAERGIDWAPRPTPEQQAQQQIEKLLADHPALAKQLGIEG